MEFNHHHILSLRKSCLLSRKDDIHLPDELLLEKYYEQYDNYWLGILLPRYTLLLLGVSMKYLKDPEVARDMVQQVFMKCMTELPRHRVEFFKSWIYQVTRNDCLMYLRKKKIAVTELSANHSYTETNITDKSDQELQLHLLETAITNLNVEQKTCIQLFYLQKKSYFEITQSTGYSLLQVKSYIQNGKRNLKMQLEDKINLSDD
ncbi:MAG: RNA polymerase sigma factor [Bacteroidota bacterium]